MKSTLAWLLMTGAPLVVAAPAFAELPTPTPTPPSASQSVLMRRPLDLRNGNGTPTSTTPTPTPTPPNTPADPGKPTVDPNVPVYVPDGPDPGQCQGVLQWSYGAWQGYGSCGETASMTRTIGCQCNTLSIGGGDGPMVLGKAETDKPVYMQASYAPGTGPSAKLSNGVYDPASSDVKAYLAQFGGEPGTGDGFKVTDVPVSYCLAELGPMPGNSYTGKGADCGYHQGGTPTYGSWQIDPGASGTIACSSQAYRKVSYPCLDGNGNQVDSSFCTENITPGGYHQDYDSGYLEYGNYSGCTAKWVGQGSDIGCWENPGDSDLADTQEVHYAYYTYVCQREDGRVLTGVDEAACPIGKPSDKRVAIGSCYQASRPEDLWWTDIAPGAIKGQCPDDVVFCWASKEYPDNGCMGTPDSEGFPRTPKAGDKRDPNDPAEWALWNYTLEYPSGKLVPTGGGMYTCYNEYRPSNYPPIPDIK